MTVMSLGTFLVWAGAAALWLSILFWTTEKWLDEWVKKAKLGERVGMAGLVLVFLGSALAFVAWLGGLLCGS